MFRRPLLAQFDATGSEPGLSLYCCFQSQPIHYVRGASASWYLTHPPWTPTEVFPQAPVNGQTSPSYDLDVQGEAFKLSPKITFIDGRSFDALPDFLETCQGCHAYHRFQPRFVLDKKSEWTCAAVKEISCVVWIASDVGWTANTHFYGSFIWRCLLIFRKYLQYNSY